MSNQLNPEYPEDSNNNQSYLPPIQFNNYLSTNNEAEPLLPNPSNPLPTRRDEEMSEERDNVNIYAQEMDISDTNENIEENESTIRRARALTM